MKNPIFMKGMLFLLLISSTALGQDNYPDAVDDLSLFVDQTTNSVLLRWSPADDALFYSVYADSKPDITVDMSTFVISIEDTFYNDLSSLPQLGTRYYTVVSSIQYIEYDFMVWIPAGEFIMGNDEIGTDAPEHEIYLDGYYIDNYPVTNAKYREYCDLAGCYCYLDIYYDDFPDHPLVGVLWDEACAYCEWFGKRLPTEAEWERAAKGNEDNRLWPWGDVFYQEISGTTYHANIDGTEDGWDITSPIGTYPTGISPTGCYDMAGNVHEHCWDYYSPDYYTMSPDSNPQGPETGTVRVRRGGAYHYSASFARCANRYWLVETYRGGCSFRCVQTP